jgi:glycerol kinase
MRLLSGDQSTAAFAHGALDPAAACLNVGTGAFVYRPAERAPPGSRLLRSVIHWGEAPEFVVEGTVNGAGSALAWFAGEHGLDDVGAALEAAWGEDGAGDVLFLNGIGGLGSPDWRPAFASRFLGGDAPERRLVAVGESIAFLVQRNLQQLQAIAPPCMRLLASGGVSRSDRFCQALANLAGLPVLRPGHCEASARGSAYLLAGRPADWAVLEAQRFAPRDDAALLARYARWTHAMASALSPP